MMENIIILENRKEFIKSIRNEFIPECIKNGLKNFVLNNQKEMFTTWDCWFTTDMHVTYKGSATCELITSKVSSI